MTGEKPQGTIKEVRERPGETSGDEKVGVAPVGQRVFSPRNIASFLLTVAVLYLVYRESLATDWRGAWASVQGANVALFALAFAVFYCSFPLRGLRWKVLLGNVGYDAAVGRPMPSASGLTRIMYVAWFANCVTVARLGDAYRGYLLKRAAGVSFAVTLGTILAERLLDLLVLAAMLGAGVLVVFGGSLPTEATRALAAGLVLSVIGVVGLLSMRRFRWAFECILPGRLHAHYSRLEHGVIDSFRRLPLLIVLSVGGWVLEGAALYFTVAAVTGAPVSVAGALVVALAASLLTAVPFTPAGLGFTEAGMIVMLGWLGLDAPTATAVTFLYRVINYWSILVFGFILYLFSHNMSQPGKQRPETSLPVQTHKSFIGRS
ncbi:MAG: flippase-like domain-containing protein [Actinomycetota bacterium]|nr:flippase-like domain-containing protein [Actinomycetota bacterium]